MPTDPLIEALRAAAEALNRAADLIEARRPMTDFDRRVLAELERMARNDTDAPVRGC